MKTGVLAASLAVALTVSGIPAYAQEAEEPAKQEKKICRAEKATGSLTRRTRICMTAAQWREYHDRTRRGIDELQGSASGNRVTPVCDAAGQGPGCVPVGMPGGAVGM